MIDLIYLDNAATSWPKPEAVYVAMDRFLRESGGNPGRGAHRMAVEAERMILETRSRVARFFGAPVPERVIFTLNATDALNMALKGLLCPGDHVITSQFEHNSVARPLNSMSSYGVQVTVVKSDSRGIVDIESLAQSIRSNTRLIVVNHASNVTGTVQPINEIARVAMQHGIKLLVDAAQTAGHIPINIVSDGVDLLACSGHKGLYGPPGVGFLIVRDDIRVRPLREGGTGVSSESPEQPEAYPYCLESGTPNSVGISGLNAGVQFVEDVGLERIREHEKALVDYLLEGLRTIPQVTVYGHPDALFRTGIVSFNIDGWDPEEVAALLDSTSRIAARAGLHCAPWAHQAIGTFPAGCVRFSVGYFNTFEDVDLALEAVRKLAVVP